MLGYRPAPETPRRVSHLGRRVRSPNPAAHCAMPAEVHGSPEGVDWELAVDDVLRNLRSAYPHRVSGIAATRGAPLRSRSRTTSDHKIRSIAEYPINSAISTADTHSISVIHGAGRIVVGMRLYRR